jgi:hypothetical protein
MLFLKISLAILSVILLADFIRIYRSDWAAEPKEGRNASK